MIPAYQISFRIDGRWHVFSVAPETASRDPMALHRAINTSPRAGSVYLCRYDDNKQTVLAGSPTQRA